jgi:hypothetical protein
MFGLTVWRPWAGLIIGGENGPGPKDVENRTWRVDYRGPLAIHAGKRVDEWAVLQHVRLIERLGIDNDQRGIIGVVELVDVVRNHRSRWAEDGQWHWVLANPRRLREPIITLRGKTSLWPVPADVEAEILAQLAG